MNDAPTMDIEIFPCAGGFAEGFRRAGVTFDMAIEWLPDHCESYEANLGHRPMQIDVRDFYRMLMDGWTPPRPVRMLVSDPPCVAFSRAGKRLGLDDPRDMLDVTCRVIALLQPEVYLIGNVPGLDDGPNLPITQRLIGGLSKYGYCTADYKRLDSANYGVPQHRIRPFWFGHKHGPCIQWPQPTHGDPDEIIGQLTIPGVTPLIPWITCLQALGHLSPEDMGRPIKLRRRESNSKQHGSVAERPARTVGTSNLSDGNVMLPPEATRAGKRGKTKNHGASQGQRVTPSDHPSPAITAAARGNQTIVSADVFALDATPAKSGGPRARDRDRTPQGDRVGDPNKPSKTLTSKVARARAGEHAVLNASEFTIQDRRGGKAGLNSLNAPSRTIVQNTVGNGSVIVNEPVRRRGQIGPDLMEPGSGHPNSNLYEPSKTIASSMPGNGAQVIVWNDKHRPVAADEPAGTLRGGGEGHSAPQIVIAGIATHLVNDKHPNADADSPSPTIGAKDRGQASVLTWSKNHPPSFADEPDGIVISEKAAAILQGFPDIVTCGCGVVRAIPWERTVQDGDVCATCQQDVRVTDWVFVGKTKKARFSQLGQAMPAPLAHAVASSVVAQLQKTAEAVDNDALRDRLKVLTGA